MKMAQYLVIGGAGGVGSAVVSALRQRGDTVIASVLNDKEAAAVAAADSTVRSFTLDLAQPDTVVAAIEAAISADSIDGVAVCAALAPIGVLESSTLADLTRTLNVNVVSSLAIFQAVIPSLRDSKGRLVMISSMAGKVAMPFVGAYSASKFALEGLADAMRRETLAQGVKVSLVEPGGIKTPMVDAQLAQVATMVAALSPEEDTLYGAYYRGFQAAASASHTTTASTPEQVADKVIAALKDADPAPRYIAGADAEQLIGAASALSDAAMDEMMAGMMRA
jgi:NAD(P)-dependent dehydrogenase (short-subunit alcohol dehydrogenase family)